MRALRAQELFDAHGDISLERELAIAYQRVGDEQNEQQDRAKGEPGDDSDRDNQNASDCAADVFGRVRAVLKERGQHTAKEHGE